jgi:plasmid stability protein
MRRTNIYLTDEQRAALAARAAAEGTSAAELVRRLIDQALLGASDDLTDDLAAIDVSFGALCADGLDAGELDIDVDRADGRRGEHLRRISQL